MPSHRGCGFDGALSYADTYVCTQAAAHAGRRQHSYWYLLDGRGSVVGLVDGSGTVVDRYAYDLWGVRHEVAFLSVMTQKEAIT